MKAQDQYITSGGSSSSDVPISRNNAALSCYATILPGTVPQRKDNDMAKEKVTEGSLDEAAILRKKTSKPGALYNYLYVMTAEMGRLEGLVQIAYTTIAEVYPEDPVEAEAREKLLALLGASHDIGQLLIEQFDTVMENEYVYQDSEKESRTDVSKFL